MRSAELDEFVERVNERTDIYSVVSRYVQLNQRGGRYWGCCPFHNEKTASFSVSTDKGLFYCFGCGAGGNVFKFLSLIENITYFEAVKLQAQRLGIELPKKKSSPEQERRRREERTLVKLNEEAQEFYHESLINTARGSVGRKYLEGRGITKETIETFRIGLAPEEWDSLLKKFTRQGYTPQQLETVGLIVKRKNSVGYYDRFRERVMIPICDVFGHVVGFGGRILTAETEATPKYLNTPETVLFNKRNLLFGLDKSNRAISSAGVAIVVEGYMDAISLFSAGIKNVVATLGTAFTPEHVKLILRYARKIIFCYDSDEAGQRATIRALPIVQQAGADVFIIKIPDGKDPDEFIRKHGKEAFEELIKNASTWIDYRIRHILANTEHSTAQGKIRALREILPIIVSADNRVTGDEYCKKIAAELVLDERLVIDEYRKALKQATKSEPIAAKRTKANDDEDLRIRMASEEILRMAWHETDTLDYVLTVLPKEIFNSCHKEIISWLETCAAQERRPDKISAAEELSEEANAELSRILLNGADELGKREIAIFEESIDILRQIVLMKEYYKLSAQAEKYIPNDETTYNKTVKEFLKIKEKVDNLKGNL